MLFVNDSSIISKRKTDLCSPVLLTGCTVNMIYMHVAKHSFGLYVFCFSRIRHHPYELDETVL
jgi:hypothetical protein